MKANRRMVNLMLIAILGVVLLLANKPLAAEPKAVRRFPIPGHGVLELNVPNPWKAQVHKPQENMPPTIILKPASGDDFQVSGTVRWSKKGEASFNSSDKVQILVEKDGQKLLGKTVESKIVLQKLRGTNSIGYYFSVTDKAPDPGEYRYMTEGKIGVGNLLLSVTILHRVEDSQSVQDALFLLREAKQRTN